jgi:PAS domain S-box-containing protein
MNPVTEWQAMFNAVSDAICLLDDKHIIRHSNTAMSKIFGLTEDQLFGKPCWQIVHNSATIIPECPVFRMEKSLRRESQVLQIAGKWFQVTVDPILDETGKHIKTVHIVRDITEQKQSEFALAAEKERLAVTLRSIGDGVIATDTRGNIVIMNVVAELLCGWKQVDAYGLPLSQVFNIINENTRKRHDNPVEKVLSSGQIIELANHTVLISPDGTERVIADSAAPIKDHTEKIIGVVLVFRDMTEKQKLQEAAQKNQKLESLGILAGGIAHDFNNLMGGIFGYIDMANEESTDANVSSYLAKAMTTIDRARGLTRQLLTFAKGGAPIRKVTPLFPFVEDTARFAISGSNAVCRFVIPDGLWLCDIDTSQLSQAIENIVINAQQAMPGGGIIEISAANVSLAKKQHITLPAGNFVRLSIKDTGIGMPKGMIAHIFDPFYTTKPKGHGLGLATCYSIINRHDGAIEVESEPGKGSTFHIFLPVSNEFASMVAPKAPPTHKGSGTFVVMDDEEVIRDSFRAVLKTMGYTVVLKNDGKAVLDFLTEESAAGRTIAGMILDLTVPGGVGGIETVAEIRKLNPTMPVFVASGYSQDPAMSSPAEYGFTDSICKPFRRVELAEMLERSMGKKE